MRIINASDDKHESIDGWPGVWLRAEASDVKGFVFSAYLLPIAPPIELRPLENLARSAFKVELTEKPVIYYYNGESSAPTTLTEFPETNVSNYFIRTRVHLENGIRLEEERPYEGLSTRLLLPDWDPVAAFLFLKLSTETDLGSFEQFRSSGFRNCTEKFLGYPEINALNAYPDGSVEIVQMSYPGDCAD